MSARLGTALALCCTLGLLGAVGRASDKADIDTSPRVYASAEGRYWLRLETVRELGDEGSKWTTTMTLTNSQLPRGERVVYTKTIDVFPDQVLVSRFGAVVALGHFGEISFRDVITVYGPDGEKRGETPFWHFLENIPSGRLRAEAFDNLRYGKGHAYEYYTPHWLLIPLSEGKVARLSLNSGKPE